MMWFISILGKSVCKLNSHNFYRVALPLLLVGSVTSATNCGEQILGEENPPFTQKAKLAWIKVTSNVSNGQAGSGKLYDLASHAYSDVIRLRARKHDAIYVAGDTFWRIPETTKGQRLEYFIPSIDKLSEFTTFLARLHALLRSTGFTLQSVLHWNLAMVSTERGQSHVYGRNPHTLLPTPDDSLAKEKWEKHVHDGRAQFGDLVLRDGLTFNLYYVDHEDREVRPVLALPEDWDLKGLSSVQGQINVPFTQEDRQAFLDASRRLLSDHGNTSNASQSWEK